MWKTVNATQMLIGLDSEAWCILGLYSSLSRGDIANNPYPSKFCSIRRPSFQLSSLLCLMLVLMGNGWQGVIFNLPVTDYFKADLEKKSVVGLAAWASAQMGEIHTFYSVILYPYDLILYAYLTSYSGVLKIITLCKILRYISLGYVQVTVIVI